MPAVAAGSLVDETLDMVARSAAVAATAAALGVSTDLVTRTIQAYVQNLNVERRKVDRVQRKNIIDRARWDADRRAHVERGGTLSPTAERSGKGHLAEGETFLAGSDARTLKAIIVQEPVERMLAHGHITKRQAEGAGQLRDDYELGIVGVREARHAGVGGRSGWKTNLTEAQLTAAHSYSRAVQSVGAMLLPVLLNVVCQGRSIDELGAPADYKVDEDGHITGTLKNSVKLRVMWQLRRGLDLLADHYRMLSDEVVAEEVVDTGVRRVEIVYRHEASGKVSGILYGGTPWLADAETVAEIRTKALARLRREKKDG